MQYSIAEKISQYGLATALLEGVRKWRPTASRNTIWLALRNPNTDTRKRIYMEAEQLVTEYESLIAQGDDTGILQQNAPLFAELD